MRNPFSITFGVSPDRYISRTIQKNEILDMFRNERPSNRTYMLVGVRGSGKTVLLNEVAKEFRNYEDWLVIELNPETDMLESLASKLFHSDKCSQLFLHAQFNVSVLGVGFSIENTPITSHEVLVEKMLRELKKHHFRLLITIDEASDTPYMRQFAHTYQMLLRNEYDICLLMTGLYENIHSLQNVKSLTFLYRTPKIYMGALNAELIKNNYSAVFDQTENESILMSKMTLGYPFAFQVLGYLKWNDPAAGLEQLRQEMDVYLSEFVYDKLWQELSNKERMLITGLSAELANSNSVYVSIKSIRENIGMNTNEISVYRDRLIKKGIVLGDKYGSLRLCLPGFDRYASRRALYDAL